MRRKYANTLPFDQDRFLELLQRCRGDRTIRQFAMDAGLTPSYLSKLLNKKRAEPPVTTSLMRICRAGRGAVSVRELFSACGYDESVIRLYEDTAGDDPSVPSSGVEYSQIFRKLLSPVIYSGYAKETEPLFSHAHFSVRSGLAPVHRTDYLFIRSMDLQQERLISYFGLLALTIPQSTREIYEFVFATDSREVYNSLSLMKITITKIPVTVILIDPENFRVLQQHPVGT